MALASIDAAAEKLLADVRNTVAPPPKESKKLERLVLLLEQEEYAKLQALALAQKTSMHECLRRFILTCQPGGSGWQHPASATAKPPEGQ